MGRVVRRLGLTVAACVGLGFAFNPTAPASSIGTRPAAAPSIYQAADTLRFTLAPGQPFLHALPERHRGEYVAYEAVELPALSWLQDRSLYWKTLPEQRGPHRLVLARTTLDAVADTVVIVVDLAAE